MSNKNDIYQKSLELLANREHSAFELSDKLSKKFSNSSNEIKEVICELIGRDYLSDERFCYSVINYRANRGYGPIWITAYLKTKGVEKDIIDKVLDEMDMNWDKVILSLHQKKFGTDNLTDYPSKAKAKSFLQSRGFSMSQIYDLYRAD
ncbi:MAG: regulatory protein RecX [Legionellales bacterium]|nr:regulatory protein RecX [Legionellales bacterium]